MKAANKKTAIAQSIQAANKAAGTYDLTPGHAQRMEAIRKMDADQKAADATATRASLYCYRACLAYGPMLPQELADARDAWEPGEDGKLKPSGSCTALASKYSQAHKVASIIGQVAATRIVDTLANSGKGTVHVLIASAFAAIIRKAKEDGIVVAKAKEMAGLNAAANDAVKARLEPKTTTRAPQTDTKPSVATTLDLQTFGGIRTGARGLSLSFENLRGRIPAGCADAFAQAQAAFTALGQCLGTLTEAEARDAAASKDAPKSEPSRGQKAAATRKARGH